MTSFNLLGVFILFLAACVPTYSPLLDRFVLTMFLLIAIAFLVKRYGTQAVPFPVPIPASAPFEAPIVARDDPSGGCQGRTVLDILWSCLATTFACTWVSVHPNVPFKGEGEWTLRSRRVFLMVFSILAPEFAIVWAFKQWRGAVMIREAVNTAFLGSDKPWTTTHGHFLQMGGFLLHTTARENMFAKDSTVVHRRRSRRLIPNDFLYRPYDSCSIQRKICDQLERATGDWWPDEISEEDAAQVDFGDDIWQGVLTFATLRNLLSENLITLPTISKDEINDRSKGDALSKGIALLQLTWFIVQIITRVAQGLAITELELTTAALAGLNSVMYIFWWSKPRDVRFPVVVRTKGVEELLANRTEVTTWRFPTSDFDFRKHLWTSTVKTISCLRSAIAQTFTSLPRNVNNALSSFSKVLKAFPRQISHSFSQICRYISRTGNAGKDVGQRHNRNDGFNDGRDDLNEVREPINSEALDGELRAILPAPLNSDDTRKKSSVRTIIEGVKSTIGVTLLPFYTLVYLVDLMLFIPIRMIVQSDIILGTLSYLVRSAYDTKAKEKTFAMIFYSANTDVRPLLSTSSIAGAMFGTVHCLAWHFSFPSRIEQVMWRTASLGVVGSCFATLYSVLIYEFIKDRRGIVAYPLLVPGGLASFAYPLARITLLVLAVTSLRSLPSSAFDAIDWVELIPHI